MDKNKYVNGGGNAGAFVGGGEPQKLQGESQYYDFADRYTDGAKGSYDYDQAIEPAIIE